MDTFVDECHFCGDTESIYVCDRHARKMLTDDEVKHIYIGGCTKTYLDKNTNLVYDIADIREAFNESVIITSTDDDCTYFRLKNSTEAFYQNKIKREQRKIAIEDFLYLLMKKFNSNLYYSKNTVANLIDSYIEIQSMTPADCAFKIYNSFVEHNERINAKNNRIELANDFLKLQPSCRIEKTYSVRTLYNDFISGKIQFDDFVTNVEKIVGTNERRKLLNELIDKNIQKKYRQLCKFSNLANEYAEKNVGSTDKLIEQFKNIILQYETKNRPTRICNAMKFFNSF